jgi:hypothetical protein
LVDRSYPTVGRAMPNATATGGRHSRGDDADGRQHGLVGTQRGDGNQGAYGGESEHRGALMSEGTDRDEPFFPARLKRPMDTPPAGRTWLGSHATAGGCPTPHGA